MRGAQHGASTAPSAPWRSVHGDLVHSQTLPIMSTRPQVVGRVTADRGGAVACPARQVLPRELAVPRVGHSPCRCGMKSRPMRTCVGGRPARAAYSHSTSLGRSLPAHRHRPARPRTTRGRPGVVPGRRGCCPDRWARASSRRASSATSAASRRAGPARGGPEHQRPGTRSASSASGKSSRDGVCSAVVR